MSFYVRLSTKARDGLRHEHWVEGQTADEARSRAEALVDSLTREFKARGVLAAPPKYDWSAYTRADLLDMTLQELSGMKTSMYASLLRTLVP